MSKKLAMIANPTVDDLARLFEAITGHKPSPEDMSEMQKEVDEAFEQSLDNIMVVSDDDDE